MSGEKGGKQPFSRRRKRGALLADVKAVVFTPEVALALCLALVPAVAPSPAVMAVDVRRERSGANEADRYVSRPEAAIMATPTIVAPIVTPAVVPVMVSVAVPVPGRNAGIGVPGFTIAGRVTQCAPAFIAIVLLGHCRCSQRAGQYQCSPAKELQSCHIRYSTQL